MAAELKVLNMALDSQHPQYAKKLKEWLQMRHTYAGPVEVKEQGVGYLKPTAGMLLDGMGKGQVGLAAYEKYKESAVFPEYVSEGVEALIGILHQKPANIQLPAKLEPLRGKATINGESLQMLLRRINEQQLITGRLGLLADMPAVEALEPMPYIALYFAEAISNWDDGSYTDGFSSLNLVVINESANVRNNFEWEWKEKYRVLQLGDFEKNEASGVSVVYKQAVFEGVDFVEAEMQPVTVRGATLDQIPFTFINATDITNNVDKAPLISLSNECLTIYRGEADYRQNLYMQSQETLVIIGGVSRGGLEDEDPDAIRTGAGSRIEIDLGGDAKYIGVSALGLEEQRVSLENDRKRAESAAAKLVNSNGATANAESGEALRTRVAAQTASLNHIALAGAAGLSHILKQIALWLGADPEQVVIIPNLEFADFELGAAEITQLIGARTMGAPLSKESIHGIMVDRGITKLDYKTEMSKIAEENADDPLLGKGLADDPKSDDNT